LIIKIREKSYLTAHQKKACPKNACEVFRLISMQVSVHHIPLCVNCDQEGSY